MIVITKAARPTTARPTKKRSTRSMTIPAGVSRDRRERQVERLTTGALLELYLESLRPAVVTLALRDLLECEKNVRAATRCGAARRAIFL
jgi:hypothetical protein